jgi:azurin
MNIKMTVLAVGCAIALSACGKNNSTDTAEPSPPPAAATVAPAATTPAPAATTAMAPATTASAPATAGAAAAGDKPAAVVNDCATEIEANDAMQFNVSSIAVPSSCSDFKITLKHTGKMPVTAMGHDVLIAKQADMAGIDADGMKAGATANYVKADDSRVIAHTKLIGGGETTSVSFPVSKIKDGGPFVFFCSFPGHSTLMHGPISVQ